MAQSGQVKISECLSYRSGQFVYVGKDEKFLEFQPRLALFLDTETTGLAGGTGTYAFLIGLGYFGADKFIVDQFFMPDYGCEPSLLYAINQKLADFQGFVSYNGRAYDFSILRARFILAKMAADLEKSHLDLLYTVRRLWKTRMPDCSLNTAEKFLLGVDRIDDLTGDQIPGIYFEFLHSGQTRLIDRVFQHNLSDILSLTGLLAISLRAFHTEGTESPDFDALGLLNTYAALKKWQEAARRAETIAAAENNPDLRLKQAEFYKKSGDWPGAVRTWEAIIAGDRFVPEAYVELAKYFEHQRKDFARALDLMNRLIRKVETLNELQGGNRFAILKAELLKRKNRLTARIANSGI